MYTTVVALGNAIWESAFVSALAHPQSPFTIVKRCVDGIDVRAIGQVHEVDVVLLSDDTLRIDASLISELKASGTRVVALSSDVRYWAEIGVHDCITVDIKNISRAIPEIAELLAGDVLPDLQPHESVGKLIALTSFGGGVGRSLFFRELGFLSAARSKITACIEADTYGPSLGQDLNLGIDTFHLLDLCKSIQGSTEFELAESFTIFEDCAAIVDNLIVVPGIPRTSQWIDLRSDLMRKTFSTLRRHFDVTLVDIGPVLESDSVASFDVGLPQRQSVALSAVQQASDIVFCTRGDVASVTRFIKNFLDCNEMFVDPEIHVVINQVREKSLGKELVKSVQRYTGIPNVVVVNDLGEETSKVSRHSDFISRQNPKSNVVHECSSLLDRILNRPEGTAPEIKLNQIIQHSDVA